MTKWSDRADGNRGDERSGRRNRNQNRWQARKPTTKAIIKIQRETESVRTIKATFKDSRGNDVKERIHTFSDGDPKANLVELAEKLIQLGDRYKLFQDGKWAVLLQTGGRALHGRCERIWTRVTSSERNHATGTQARQREKFLELIKKSLQKILGSRIADNQIDAMQLGELNYDGHNHEAAVERLLEINDQIQYLAEDAESFSPKEMAKRIIPKNLKPSARLKWIEMGGKALSDPEEMIDLAGQISDMLEAKYEIECEQKQHRNRRSKRSNDDLKSDNESADNSKSKYSKSETTYQSNDKEAFKSSDESS